MVQLTVFTNHPLFAGVTVSFGIEIEGQEGRATEFPFPDNPPHKTYVVSENDKLFKLVLDITNPNPAHTYNPNNNDADGPIYLAVDFWVDGALATGKFITSLHTEILGKRVGNAVLPFKFVAPTVAFSGGVSDEQKLASFGTIQFRFSLARKSKEYRQSSKNTATGPIFPDTIDESAINADSITTTTMYCHPVPLVAPKLRGRQLVETLHTHTFYYNSKGYFERNGIWIKDEKAELIALRLQLSAKNARITQLEQKLKTQLFKQESDYSFESESDGEDDKQCQQDKRIKIKHES
ncbi:hypothetical protein HK100_002219 [Physocladia obscura]|uniref:Uncharacterized protein n=1 Tax=Physocladia obscura TaxID=109957 RepID=A0AAD5T1N6_9FUNG|nr:hypothetical protein HK100_002219 [Physocladia obscura]